MTTPSNQRKKLLLILERDPRTAVILAEILAPPVSARPPR